MVRSSARKGRQPGNTRKKPIFTNEEGIQVRECYECGETKPLNLYTTDKRRLDGYFGNCRACATKVQKKRRTKEIIKNDNLWNMYGIDLEDYKRMYQMQDGKCRICRADFPTLAVDHCHNTSNIRGLLCRGCNVGLGNFKDSIENLRNAIIYLLETNSGYTSS